MRKFKNCLSVRQAFPAETQEYVVGEDVEFIVLLLSTAPLIQTLTEFAVSTDIRQSSPIAVKSVAQEESAWGSQLLEMGSETKK